MSAAPKEQFRPMAKSGKCATDVRNAPSVCPESVRPALSATVADKITGRVLPFCSITSAAAQSAALALSVSKAVSMMKPSTPPSISAAICSR